MTMTLSDGEQAALKNLAAKHAGQEVGWIAISHARSLTDRGLAERVGSGWQITENGLASFKTLTETLPVDGAHQLINLADHVRE
jgi:hypothetical protein